MSRLEDIPVALCRPSPSARPVLAIKVEELKRSILDVGLRQPISVRPIGEHFEIRGGGHRHAAYAALGRETIPAFVREDDDLHAELAEIDENLVRNELGPAERAAAVARRKAIYEALHPATAHGGDRKSSRQLGDLKEPERFTKATSDATGASERSIQREARRGEALGEASLRAVAGTSLDKGEELDALAALTEKRREKLIDRAAAGEKVSAKIEVKKERRDTRERSLGEKQRALPAKRYGVILADPEWRFEVYSRDTGMDRSADNHYPTSDLEVIKSRPVGEIAADDCVLFLWATAPMLPQALTVMAAWGFTYRSQAIWSKDRIGTGYWFRNRHELLLVGTRGGVPAPAMGTQWASVIEAPVGEHSAKPETFHELIEAYFPNLPKIELNARRSRPGWDAWGLEAPESSPSDAPPDLQVARDVREEAAPIPNAGASGGGAASPPSASGFKDNLEIPPGLVRKSAEAAA